MSLSRRLRRVRKIKSVRELIDYLTRDREFGRREIWRDIVLGEIISDELANKVAEKILSKLPRPQPVREAIPQLFMREPHEMVITARTILIRSDRHGYIEEFGFITLDKNYVISLLRDNDYYLQNEGFDSMSAKSEYIGWLTADVTEDGYYLFQVGGIEWERNFEITITPTAGVINLYNVFWKYYEFSR